MADRDQTQERGSQGEILRGDEVSNVRTRRVIRIVGRGKTEEILVEERDSRPDQNGGYDEREVTTLMFDQAGNAFPADSRDIVAISHSGLYIRSQEQLAQCTCWLHTKASRNILLGQDGRRTDSDKYICSGCDSWFSTLKLILILLIIAVFMGIFAAAWNL